MAKNAMKGSMGKQMKEKAGKDGKVPPGFAKKMGKPGMAGKKARG